ncbi:MAG: tetratricopeptide repeat protein, partial [Planctomycetes bacterium]|nr:tetratricopeptide repeat protein [Planctomycetota bacterium]
MRMRLKWFGWLWFVVLLVGVVGCQSGTGQPASGTAKPAAGDLSAYAGSASCADCHKQAYDEWRTSNHANAQRDLSPAIDDEVFTPKRTIHHGSQISFAEKDGDKYILTTAGPNGQPQPFTPSAALGVFPLWQYIIPGPNGRFQLTELAWDPARKEWFNVYGEEDRQAGEWGHWTGRGMNWNSMCAPCHTTAFQKNYDALADRYTSRYVEQGVGCESCHGPMRKHVEFQKSHPEGGYFGDPTIRKLSADNYMAVCGACHSRHGDMTGKFQPGEQFLDHFDPVLPDLSNIFHPDGQVLDEDFEYNVFMLSYMHDSGVRCNNCHSPHTSKIRRPASELCLECHQASMGGRIPIDQAAHGFHPLDKAGSQCTDCHYPRTVYMQRHWRHDHGMTIPDPQLTKEFGIPNACNRCHQDQTVDWAIEWTEKWYGPRMDRPTRQRARVLARLKRNDAAAVPEALELLKTEHNGAWRAVYLKMLAPLVVESPDADLRQTVRQAMLDRLGDSSPLVQAAAIDALDPLGDAVADNLKPALQAPYRLVRAKAAWALRRQIDLQSPAGQELSALLTYNLDQPTGAFRWANFLTETGRPDQALAWYAKAVAWDGGSAPFRHSYAVALSQLHRLDEALEQLAAAARVAPNDALYPYSMGLILAEMNRLPEARDALKKAV